MNQLRPYLPSGVGAPGTSPAFGMLWFLPQSVPVVSLTGPGVLASKLARPVFFISPECGDSLAKSGSLDVS